MSNGRPVDLTKVVLMVKKKAVIFYEKLGVDVYALNGTQMTHPPGDPCCTPDNGQPSACASRRTWYVYALHMYTYITCVPCMSHNIDCTTHCNRGGMVSRPWSPTYTPHIALALCQLYVLSIGYSYRNFFAIENKTYLLTYHFFIWFKWCML